MKIIKRDKVTGVRSVNPVGPTYLQELGNSQKSSYATGFFSFGVNCNVHSSIMSFTEVGAEDPRSLSMKLHGIHFLPEYGAPNVEPDRKLNTNKSL